MKAIVTVIGKDRIGIIANISRILSQQKINVLDISQTVLQGYFTMIMLVDTAECPIAFDKLAALLRQHGEEEGYSVRIQREDIFEAMHRI